MNTSTDFKSPGNLDFCAGSLQRGEVMYPICVSQRSTVMCMVVLKSRCPGWNSNPVAPRQVSSTQVTEAGLGSPSCAHRRELPELDYFRHSPGSLQAAFAVAVFLALHLWLWITSSLQFCQPSPCCFTEVMLMLGPSEIKSRSVSFSNE